MGTIIVPSFVILLFAFFYVIISRGDKMNYGTVIRQTGLDQNYKTWHANSQILQEVQRRNGHVPNEIPQSHTLSAACFQKRIIGEKCNKRVDVFIE